MGPSGPRLWRPAVPQGSLGVDVQRGEETLSRRGAASDFLPGSRSPSPSDCPHSRPPRPPVPATSHLHAARVLEGGEVNAEAAAGRPRSGAPPRPVPQLPQAQDLSSAARGPPAAVAAPARAGPGPYPRQGEVGHELLEGPRLLGLPLRVQRDLLTELPRVGAARARRGGHSAAQRWRRGDRGRGACSSAHPSVRQSAGRPSLRPRPFLPRDPGEEPPRPHSQRAAGSARDPPPRRPRPRPRPPHRPPTRPPHSWLTQGFPGLRSPQRADPEESPSSKANGSREELSYHLIKTVQFGDSLAFGVTLQF